MSQSYKKYEITTTFKREICRNLNKKARLRQISLYVTPGMRNFLGASINPFSAPRHTPSGRCRTPS